MEQYYAELGEIDRLTSTALGRIEFLRTREIVERALPAQPCEVLDVGGATGIHAEWLARAGHRVHVIDPAPAHVDHAARLPGVTAAIGDARRLDRPDASVDVALLLGPLYHLAERSDRVLALQEARRVVRPGGPVLAAAICRYASMLDMAAFGRLGDEAVLASVRETVRTGHHDPALGFTTANFHTTDELAAEFESAGLCDVEVLGVEGPGYLLLRLVDDDEALFESVLLLARETEAHPALSQAGCHLIAIGYC